MVGQDWSVLYLWLFVDNKCLSMPRYVVLYNHRNEAFICERRRVKTVFYEKMEVNQFPFDTQVIHGDCAYIK